MNGIAREVEFYHALAADYLKYFGNENPNKVQIETMKSILSNTWLKKSIVFDHRLTNREKGCLYLASQGNDSKEIADILGISSGTVRIHRQEIIRKLGCKNMVQAVALGIKYGEVAMQMEV